MCFTESIVMRTTPEAAFAYLADPSTAPVIDPAVISYEPDTVPMRVGTHNKIRTRMYGIPVNMESEVTEWEEGRRMVMQSVKPARPVFAIATHVFEPHPEGTRYTWSMQMLPTGPAGGPLCRLMTRVMQRNARRQQRRFKIEMERDA